MIKIWWRYRLADSDMIGDKVIIIALNHSQNINLKEKTIS